MPLVIYDKKTLKPELTVGEVPGTMYGLSNKGWIDTELFESWFTNHFLAYAPPSQPLLLLMDGHSSHFSPLFVNSAPEEQIIGFCLPPNSTHKTQPLDKGVFGPLKRSWREECHSYIMNNPGKVITRYQFSMLIGKAWMKSVIPSNIVSGFRITGIYPTDRYKVIPKSPSKPLCEQTGLKNLCLLLYISSPLHHSSRITVHKNQSSVSPMYSVHSHRIPIHDHEKDVDVSNISLLSESANNSPMVPFSGEHSPRVSPESTNLDYLHVPFMMKLLNIPEGWKRDMISVPILDTTGCHYTQCLLIIHK